MKPAEVAASQRRLRSSVHANNSTGVITSGSLVFRSSAQMKQVDNWYTDRQETNIGEFI